jgi:hypothetical protein
MKKTTQFCLRRTKRSKMAKFRFGSKGLLRESSFKRPEHLVLRGERQDFWSSYFFASSQPLTFFTLITNHSLWEKIEINSSSETQLTDSSVFFHLFRGQNICHCFIQILLIVMENF